MNATVLAAAAADPGEWSVQPSLACTALVFVLLVGFYLGRVSHEVHSAWLRGWDVARVWLTWGLAGVGLCTVLWFAVTRYGGSG